MPHESFEKLPVEKQEKILNTGIRIFSMRSYRDVSTDVITRECGVSKGILFHYFGSKQEYYLACLNTSLQRLTETKTEAEGADFYDILFETMKEKFSICRRYRDEMHLVNMASRDASEEIKVKKAELIQEYRKAVHQESAEVLAKALSRLPLKKKSPLITEGLQTYVSAVMNRYLLQYQEEPDRFFEEEEAIRSEMKEYLNLFLYGIAREEL